jgi:trk system potassium uptake protein TrkH
MDIRNIPWYLGIFMIVSGILSFFPILVALYYGEPIVPLVFRFLLFLFVGAILVRHPRKDLDFGDAMLLVAVSMMIIPFFGAIPFFTELEGRPLDILVDGYFEGVSGYTTSGFTIFSEDQLNPASSSYKHSLIFSRTLMEWTGGLGVIILFLSLLAKGGISTVYLYRVESGGQRIVPNIDHTAKIIVRIYLFYTFTGMLILWLLNMEPLYALSTIMSVLSTGGFISLVGGIHTNVFSEMVILLFLLLAAIPFTLDHMLLSGNLRRFFSNLEIRFGCLLMLVAILIFTPIFINSVMSLMDCLHRGVFVTIGAVTTGGYGGGIVGDLKGPGILLVIVLMMVGGGAGSTAGGIKIVRVGVLLKAIHWLIRKLSLPETAMLPFKINKSVFRDEELRNIGVFFFIYVALLLFGTFSLMTWGTGGEGGVELTDAFFLSVSTQSNVGFTTLDIGIQSILVKITMIFQMIAGRLEIFPVLALIGYLIKGFEHEVVEIEKEVREKKKREDEIERRIEFMRKLRRADGKK